MAKKKRKQPTTWYGKAWHYVWYDDSLGSWLVNILLAFILIKFIVYPLLGFFLGTGLPVVAVVSESMDHQYTKQQCTTTYQICGHETTEKERLSFDAYWQRCGLWYETNGISSSDFKEYRFKNGFSKGDIIILRGKKPEAIKEGDVIVFQSRKPYPIIHRVVEVTKTTDGYVYETKGDHNVDQITPAKDPLTRLDETNVHEDVVLGVAAAKVPFLGWVKVGIVDLFQGNNC